MDQIYLEKEIENLKIGLAKCKDFTCKQAFSLFDYRNLRSLSEAEFSESMFSFIGTQFHDRSQLKLLFKRYD